MTYFIKPHRAFESGGSGSGRPARNTGPCIEQRSYDWTGKSGNREEKKNTPAKHGVQG